MANVDAAAPVPHSLEAPAPAHPVRPVINFVFPVRERPPGSPGKDGFCMKEVFNLDGREYMMVLNSIREIAIACRLDMLKPITRQNQTVVRKIYEKTCDVFPGFRAFAEQDNHQWPVEAFLMVILKSASDTRSGIRRAKACDKVATASPNTKARRKMARQESARRSALARAAAKRKATEARVDTKLGLQDAVEEMSRGLDEMSFKYDNDVNHEMDYEPGPVFGGSFFDHAPISAHETAQSSAPVSAPVYAPVVHSHVPSAAALARRPPPIPSAATRPRPRPRPAEDSLDSAATSAPFAMSASSIMSAPTATPALTAAPAPTATSAPVGPANVVPAPLTALARLPPPIPPAATRPRPLLRQAGGPLGSIPVPAPTPEPTPVPTPTPAPTPAPSPTSTSFLMSAPDDPADDILAPVPVATSTPVRARTSTSTRAALTTAPFAIHSRVSAMLLSLGTPDVNRTLLDVDVDDDLADSIPEEPKVVGKGKGKATGGARTKTKAGAEAAPQAEPSTAAQPAAKAPCRKKVVEVPPTAPAARTRSKTDKTH